MELQQLLGRVGACVQVGRDQNRKWVRPCERNAEGQQMTLKLCDNTLEMLATDDGMLNEIGWFAEHLVMECRTSCDCNGLASDCLPGPRLRDCHFRQAGTSHSIPPFC